MAVLLVVAGFASSTFAAADGDSSSTNSRSSGENASNAAAASTTSRAPFSAFKIITTTNIFNTKRQRGYEPTTNRTARYTRTESFGLVGVMSYDKGPFAFFEGSGSEYQKVLKPDEIIAGFKLGEIEPAGVKLISPTNEVELKVGMQLTRMDGGPWQLGQRPENLDSRVTFTAQPAAPREERPQQDAPPFGFPPPGGFQLPDAIQQAIATGLQNAGQGGTQPQPVIIQAPNGQPQNGGAPSEDVIQRMIRRRQQEQGN